MAKAARASKDGESVGGYWRKVLTGNPRLLGRRSNDELYKQWLKDHPEDTEVPDRAKNGLANVKSLMRRNRRKKGKGSQEQDAVVASKQSGSSVSLRNLENLEEHIDDCLSVAKHLNRDELESVIRHLRRARNEVVMKIGQ